MGSKLPKLVLRSGLKLSATYCTLCFANSQLVFHQKHAPLTPPSHRPSLKRTLFALHQLPCVLLNRLCELPTEARDEIGAILQPMRGLQYDQQVLQVASPLHACTELRLSRHRETTTDQLDDRA